jgi:CheY-like chemotaxis protein
MLESMQRAVDRGALLTQQLLSFARQQPLKVEKNNLNSLIGGFESVLRRAGNSSILFEIHLQPKLRMALIDAARFEAALLNLVVNARDAMPQGGRLAISTENVDLTESEPGRLAPGPYIRVAVMDTGSGMTPEVMARAFEPFFTTKEVGRGTGLGLSQVYGFIAQSGGDIRLESEVGKGTTVSIYLPAMQEGDGSDTAIATETQTETVLIVEDESDLLEVAAELFRSIGYDVLTAGQGSDAIDILKRRSDIDILFTDVMMPNGMTGIDLARKARQMYPGIKIILASGYPLPALKAHHGNLDDFVFMTKPYRLSELAKKLRANN